MNRKFVLPAAIALTLHALLFVGSGQPPTHNPPPSGTKPKEEPSKLPEEVIFEKTIELLKPVETAVTEPESKGGGGSPEASPISVPDIAPVGTPGPLDITEEYRPITPGKGDKIPTAGFPGFGDGDGTGPGPRTLTASMLDNPPRTSSQREPIYPHAMKVTGTTGTVWVEFVVDERGRVHDVRVIKSTNDGFNDATIAAVSTWRFEPGKRKGLPVPFRMSIPIQFNLND